MEWPIYYIPANGHYVADGWLRWLVTIIIWVISWFFSFKEYEIEYATAYAQASGLFVAWTPFWSIMIMMVGFFTGMMWNLFMMGGGP